jgi:hypothetical protein
LFIIGSENRIGSRLEDTIVFAEQSAYKSKGKKNRNKKFNDF